MMESQINTTTEPPLLLELDDVVDKTERTALDSAAYYQHLSEGTLEQYYQQVLQQLAIDIMAIPVDRAFSGLSPIEDPEEVVAAVDKIADLLSRTFSKAHQSVQKDLNAYVAAMPLSDVRAARKAKSEGRLN